MTVPTVPWEHPEQSEIWIGTDVSPYTPAWWTTHHIDEIPADSVGWMVAQGWRITDIDFDEDTNPPTPYYTMTRQSLQNWIILQAILNSYTDKYNKALLANSIRYNDVVRDWTEMLASSQTHFAAETAQQNSHVSIYMGNLDTYMSELDALVDANKTTLDAAIATSGSLLNTMQSEFDTFQPEIDAVIALLDTDYDAHAALARGFLTDLGSTETARINEKFDNDLSVQTQQLIDRGLYSSGVIADITTRNTREKSEATGELNDRLNREKLANQHTLYGQLVATRGQTLQSKERLHSLALDVLKYREAQTVNSARALADLRSSIITQQMSISMARLEGLYRQHTDSMKLMAYQLDTRNQLLIGLYGFVERREDTYPSFENLVQIATGLGDAGGGWVTP